jgi:hypothetical protein
VGTIVGNLGRDCVTAGKYVGSFFTSTDPVPADQVEEKTFLLPVTKP